MLANVYGSVSASVAEERNFASAASYRPEAVHKYEGIPRPPSAGQGPSQGR